MQMHNESLTTNFSWLEILHEFKSADSPGGHSKREPPESISNSVVKTFRADDSAELFRVKVGTAGHYFPFQLLSSIARQLTDYLAKAD